MRQAFTFLQGQGPSATQNIREMDLVEPIEPGISGQHVVRLVSL
jgi:hypothetical protein